MTVLVTGATGNVGAPVVRALRARGVPVRAAARSPEAVRRAFGPDVEAVALDLARPETYAPALAGGRVRGLFLLRPPPVADVRSTLNVLVDRAAAAGVEHVVFLSVQGAERLRWVPHHAVEAHLQAGRVPWTLLRASFFAQNLGEAYRADVREDGRLYVPAGEARVTWVDTRDVGEAAAVAFTDTGTRGQAYVLTGPEARGFAEVAALLSDALGRPVRYVPARLPGYVRHLRRRGLPWAQVGVQSVLHLGLKGGASSVVDPALARLLGRRPRTVEAYVRDAVDLWR